MAEDNQEPAQTEGAGQPAKKARPEPVNLAMIEAAKRGITLEPPKRPAKQAPEPEPNPAQETPPADIPPAAPAEASEAADGPEAEEAGASTSAETPAGEPPAAADSGDPAESPVDKLARLAEAATKGRLSPADEDRATRIMREFIKTGSLEPAMEAMNKLPWILGVRAAEQSWQGLDEAARAALLDGIVGLQGENASRLRLSLSRSLAKIDAAAGLRLAAQTCRSFWDAEKGALTPEHSKLIGNVFIGRGKPWVLQLPLATLPAEDAQPIAACAVFSAFNVNNPPITQLSILRHAAPFLATLPESLLNLVAKGVGRWSGKWQASLRKEIAEIPAPIAAVMKSEKGEPAAEAAPAPISVEDEPLPAELEEKMKAAAESGDPAQVDAATQEVNAWRETRRAELEAARDAAAAAAADAEPDSEQAEAQDDGKDRKKGRREKNRERMENRERERAEARERNDGRDRGASERQEKKERPAYVSREQERQAETVKTGGAFNLSASLKQIESYVAQLRNELGNAQAKLRKAETAPRRTDRVSLSVEEANLSPDELRRIILQLEGRNNDLQARVEELMQDSEQRVQSIAAAGGENATEEAKFRALLALKLQTDYTDFIALEKGSPDVIVRQHYRGLLRDIFAVLVGEGIPLVGDLPPPPPTPLPPPPPPPVLEEEDAEEDDEELDAPVEPLREDEIAALAEMPVEGTDPGLGDEAPLEDAATVDDPDAENDSVRDEEAPFEQPPGEAAPDDSEPEGEPDGPPEKSKE